MGGLACELLVHFFQFQLVIVLLNHSWHPSIDLEVEYDHCISEMIKFSPVAHLPDCELEDGFSVGLECAPQVTICEGPNQMVVIINN